MTREPRDSGLANERTSLAWIRTAAALSAGGLAATATSLKIGHAGLIVPFALAALAGGILLVLSGDGPHTVAWRPFVAWVGTLAVLAGTLVFALTRIAQLDL